MYDTVAIVGTWGHNIGILEAPTLFQEHSASGMKASMTKTRWSLNTSNMETGKDCSVAG